MSWPQWFGGIAGAALLAVVSVGLWRFVLRRRRVAAALGDPELLRRLLGTDLRRVPWPRVALTLVAATALAAALLDPRWGTADEPMGVQGGPVVLVVDVSSSMLVEDQRPSRLAWARATASALVESLGDLPVGIVVFAGRAYALAPPTRDPGALDLYLDALDTGMITQTGSALAGALRQGVGLLMAGDAEGGSLVVISDGNTNEDPRAVEQATGLAARAGIPVFVVGVGSATGGPVPDLHPVSGERLGFKRYPDGSAVESRLTESLLRDIARETGGSYLAAGPEVPERLAALVRAVDGEAAEERRGAPRYAWFAAIALALLVFEGLIGRRKDA